jgi:hypothetical protein
MKRWKVWTSSSVYNCIDHKASDIPPDVQVVMYYLDYPQRHVEMGEDFYVVDGVTLVGTYMDMDAFWKVADTAMSDMEWPE